MNRTLTATLLVAIFTAALAIAEAVLVPAFADPKYPADDCPRWAWVQGPWCLFRTENVKLRGDHLDEALAAHMRGDYATALKLLKPLVAKRNAMAQLALGIMYDKGMGVPQDHKNAARLFRLATVQQNPEAQFHLGTMYEDGHGVPQDYIRAHMWYNLGTALAHNDSKAVIEMGRDTIAAARDSIAAKMSPAQIAEAQAMARKCEATNFKQCD